MTASSRLTAPGLDLPDAPPALIGAAISTPRQHRWQGGPMD